ncbi:MAG: YkgJ family cysteine cluster protein [Nanobdellota archaeon]
MNLCGDCRNCCTFTYVRIRDEDIKRWKEENRYDIIICLDTWVDNNRFLIHKDNMECIFLGEHGCDIYETRPEVCREYPKSAAHAKKFGCKFEAGFAKDAKP